MQQQLKEVDDRITALGGIHPIAQNDFVPMSMQELEAIQSHLNTVFPKEYQYLLTKYGCFGFRNFVTYDYSPCVPHEVISTGSGIAKLYGAKHPNPQLASGLWENIEFYRDRLPRSMIPIGRDGFGNLICLGISGTDQGKVFFWEHDEEIEVEDFRDEAGNLPYEIAYFNLYHIADDFRGFLQKLTVTENYAEDEDE